jgi:hypothetical protein
MGQHMRMTVGLLSLIVLILAGIVAFLLAKRLLSLIRDVRQLNKYREFVSWLSRLADTHAELNDPFAIIVTDELRQSTLKVDSNEVA